MKVLLIFCAVLGSCLSQYTDPVYGLMAPPVQLVPIQGPVYVDASSLQGPVFMDASSLPGPVFFGPPVAVEPPIIGPPQYDAAPIAVFEENYLEPIVVRDYPYSNTYLRTLPIAKPIISPSPYNPYQVRAFYDEDDYSDENNNQQQFNRRSLMYDKYPVPTYEKDLYGANLPPKGYLQGESAEKYRRHYNEWDKLKGKKIKNLKVTQVYNILEDPNDNEEITGVNIGSDIQAENIWVNQDFDVLKD